MSPNNKRSPLFAVVALMWLTCASSSMSAQQAKKPFTVADEIGLALFIPHIGAPNSRFSPDGNFFAVYSERGRLELNRVEDSLRFYRSQDVQSFLKHSDESQPPLPVWVVDRSTNKEGPIIGGWHWLADSSGVAFLERTAGGGQRLAVADLQKKVIEPLTPSSQNVEAFDIRDRNHYVYTAAAAVAEKEQADRVAPAIVGTGRSLFELLLPDDRSIVSPPKSLWAVVGSRRFEVKKDGAPIVPGFYMALSPDGSSLVTYLQVDAPPSWETLYPPPFASSDRWLHAGRSVGQFVRIALQTGSVRSLTDAPLGGTAGWWASGNPSWSSDGQQILLPGTFLKSKENAPSRPCVAVVDLASNTRTCVEVLKGETATGVEEGYHYVTGAQFDGAAKERVIVVFTRSEDHSIGTTEYQRMADGTWQVIGRSNGLHEVGEGGLEVTVKQGLNEPPLLVASNQQTSRVLWDPNPQLKNIELGQVSVYKWKGTNGKEQTGGLYKPIGYKPGERYPLVIQTHGFGGTWFSTSGTGFPTAFAARALASAGIAVLQAGEPCPGALSSEAPCAVSGYEAAINQLVAEGVADPGKVGIIGFSRSCFYVMEALTAGSVHFQAATVTDGVMFSYFQYILQPDRYAPEYNSAMGASPFGDGLQQWLKRSPGFKLDKINTPLMVVGEGPRSLLFMWETYAGLHYLKKPVDLIMLNTDEHVLTNPAVRMASQGGSVDWFRFWLQDYEDRDPAKAEQYKRWRELRKMQAENDDKGKAAKKPAPLN